MWQALSQLPKRVEALEKRIETLETALASPKRSGPICPICNSPMKVAKVTDDPTFGRFGVKRHFLECTECDHKDTLQVDPRERG